jgi:hypothetical protein
MTKKNLRYGVSHDGRFGLDQQRDGGDEQRVVGERREKLRRHDDVEAVVQSRALSPPAGLCRFAPRRFIAQ